MSAAVLASVAPMPPVWVGGASTGALRRAVRYGDGWLSGLQPREEFAASRRQLFELADQAGRPRPRTGVGLHAALGPRPGPELKRLTRPAAPAAAARVVLPCPPQWWQQPVAGPPGPAQCR
jgi:hypothetical protein